MAKMSFLSLCVMYWYVNFNFVCLQQILGCNIISALMQEYATTVKSSDVGLTWETHFKAKKQFQVQQWAYLLDSSYKLKNCQPRM
jgi:hypothetical protein